MSAGRESLILQLLNKDVNESLLAEIEKDYKDIPDCYRKSSLSKRIGHFNKHKRKLHKIFHRGEVEKHVNEMEDLLNVYCRPIFKFNANIDLRIVPFDKDEIFRDSKTFVERIVGEAFYYLSLQGKVYNVISCAHCNKYFVAIRKDAQFCSTTCKRQADFKKRKKIYYQTFLNRRIDGKYIPVNNIHCYNCRTPIPIPKQPNGRINKSIEIIKCSACKTANRNPWASQKQKSR